MNFTAVHFKFANTHKTSLFEIEITIVKNGNIVQNNSIQIKPQPNYFNFRNKFIYNINSVNDSKVIKEDFNYFKGNIEFPSEDIVFDNILDYDLYLSLISDLSKNTNSFKIYSLSTLSKESFPNLLNSQKDILSAKLFNTNLSFKNDSEKIALISIELLKYHKSNSFSTLQNKLNNKNIFSVNTKHQNSFLNKRISFLENLEILTRKNAQRLVRKVGGIIKPENLSNKTDFLIVGQSKYKDYIENTPQNIKSIKSNNIEFELISEKTFLEFVMFEKSPYEVTIEQIEKDSSLFLKRNRYNEFSGKRIFFSEHLSINRLHAFQLVGNCSGFGHDYDIESIPDTDFFIISSQVIKLLKNGEKTNSILEYEKQMNKTTEKANTSNISDNIEFSKRTFFIDEKSFLEYMNRRQLFQKGKIKMNIYEWEIPKS